MLSAPRCLKQWDFNVKWIYLPVCLNVIKNGRAITFWKQCRALALTSRDVHFKHKRRCVSSLTGFSWCICDFTFFTAQTLRVLSSLPSPMPPLQRATQPLNKVLVCVSNTITAWTNSASLHLRGSQWSCWVFQTEVPIPCGLDWIPRVCRGWRPTGHSWRISRGPTVGDRTRASGLKVWNGQPGKTPKKTTKNTFIRKYWYKLACTCVYMHTCIQSYQETRWTGEEQSWIFGDFDSNHRKLTQFPQPTWKLTCSPFCFSLHFKVWKVTLTQ